MPNVRRYPVENPDALLAALLQRPGITRAQVLKAVDICAAFDPATLTMLRWRAGILACRQPAAPPERDCECDDGCAADCDCPCHEEDADAFA